MSAPQSGDTQTQKPGTRAGVKLLRLRRLESQVAGEIAVCPASAFLPLQALGAAIALGRELARLPARSTHPVSVAHRLLEVRGIPTDEASGLLSLLCAAGLLARSGDTFTMPAFDAVVRSTQAKFRNRSAGRSKIHTKPSSEPAVSHQQRAAPVEHLDAQTTLVPLGGGPVVMEAPPFERKAKRRKFQLGDDARFGPTDASDPSDEDPTVARIVCECGGHAEITQSYVDHLQSAYQGVDVLDQIRKAAVWCDGNRARRKTMAGVRRFLATWLNNSARDAQMRASLTRAAAKGNGFGNGGSYVEQSDRSQSESHGEFNSDDLDFSDMTSRNPGLERQGLPRASTLYASRARRTAGSAPAARKEGQRRLSEQLR